MIEPHVQALSLAIEAMAGRCSDGRALAAEIRRTYPEEPILILRRAIYYAVTDPDRKDDAVTLKLFDAAFAILAGADRHAA